MAETDHRSPDEEKAKVAMKQTFMDSRVDPSLEHSVIANTRTYMRPRVTTIINIHNWEVSSNVTLQNFQNVGAFDHSRN